MNEGKMRPCLGVCGEIRWSEDRGDRICKPCKKLQGKLAEHGKRATQKFTSVNYRREILDT